MPRVDVELEWAERQVTIHMQDKKTTAAVKAWCLGPVAVHPKVSHDVAVLGKWYTVTSIRHGRAAAHFSAVAEARAFAEVLANDTGAARFLAGQVGEPPAWLEPWVAACREANRCLDVSPFKEQ